MKVLRCRLWSLAGAIFMLTAYGCGDSAKSDDGVHFVGKDTSSEGDVILEPDISSPKYECISSQDCPATLPFCDLASHVCVECRKNEHCSNPKKPYCNPAKAKCVECLMPQHCPSEFQYCLDGKCSEKPCIPNHPVCIGNTIHYCSPDGMDPHYKTVPCGKKKCYQGECLECEPNKISCLDDHTVIKCSADGKSYETLDVCVGETQCFAGACMVCYPGKKKCDGNVSMQCKNDGSGWIKNEDCSASGLTCYMGACLNPCAGDLKQNTNAGCEFYAVDLDNAIEGENDAQNAQYAIIVSNTSKTDSVDVTVQRPDGQSLKATIPKGKLHKFELPPTWGLDGTEKSKKAFKISASRPVVVYQFNPLSNKEEVFSNDASVLLPTPSLGTKYYVMSYKQYENVFRSYVAIIGVSSVPTQVTITPTCKTLAGGGIPALSPGESHTIEITQGEVLNIESDQFNGDLTGTLITSNAPVAVFGGHEAVNTSNLCCADHLEQQLIPVKAWGKHYLLSKTWERWKEQDYVRILASEDDTHVSVNPPVTVVPVLNAGQHHTFQTKVNLEISADRPIIVAQYLASSYEILGTPKAHSCTTSADCPAPFYCYQDYIFGGECVGPDCTNDSQCPSGTTCEMYLGYGSCAPIGDPAMALVVSEEQYMKEFVFLVPDAYVHDYLNVIAPLNADHVVLDDVQINPAAFTPIGSSGFGVYRQELKDGVHVVYSDKKVGILVYGYDDDVSYAYPGGMGLVELHF